MAAVATVSDVHGAYLVRYGYFSCKALRDFIDGIPDSVGDGSPLEKNTAAIPDDIVNQILDLIKNLKPIITDGINQIEKMQTTIAELT